jgi:hypothetical protein
MQVNEMLKDALNNGNVLFHVLYYLDKIVLFIFLSKKKKSLIYEDYTGYISDGIWKIILADFV